MAPAREGREDVVEARRVGATLDEVVESVETQWKSLDTLKVVNSDN